MDKQNGNFGGKTLGDIPFYTALFMSHIPTTSMNKCRSGLIKERSDADICYTTQIQTTY